MVQTLSYIDHFMMQLWPYSYFGQEVLSISYLFFTENDVTTKKLHIGTNNQLGGKIFFYMLHNSEKHFHSLFWLF